MPGRLPVRFLCFALAAIWVPVLLRAHGDLHDRIHRLSVRIEAQPTNSALFLERADLNAQHEAWASALADCDTAARLGCKNVAVDLVRGRAQASAGQPDQALASFQRVLAAQPSHTAAQDGLARALAALGRHPEAAEAFERVADLSADPGPFVEAATEWKAANEWGRALAILDRGIARLGRLVSLQEPALELEVRMNRVDAALKRLDQLIAATPRQEAWLVRRAEILADAHRTDDALTARDQATAAIAALPARLRHAPAARDLSRRLATLAVPAS